MITSEVPAFIIIILNLSRKFSKNLSRIVFFRESSRTFLKYCWRNSWKKTEIIAKSIRVQSKNQLNPWIKSCRFFWRYSLRNIEQNPQRNFWRKWSEWLLKYLLVRNLKQNYKKIMKIQLENVCLKNCMSNRGWNVGEIFRYISGGTQWWIIGRIGWSLFPKIFQNYEDLFSTILNRICKWFICRILK